MADRLETAATAQADGTPNALYRVGDLVVSIRDPSRTGSIVRDLGLRGGVHYFQVFWGGSRGVVSVSAADLCPAGILHDESPTGLMTSGHFGGRSEFVRAITYSRLARRGTPRNQLLAFNASRSRFFPHQFTPLLKFLESPNGRMLIADEVGLGKTIEAGLILTELKARQDVPRVLIACPSRLCQKWRTEMQRRFEEDFRVLNAATLLEWLREYQEAPERTRLRGIVGLESARVERVLRQLHHTDPALDLLIVDEAHHLRNFGRQNRKLGEALSGCADAVLFLTATPVMLGRENLYSLFNLLAPDDFPDQQTALARFQGNEPVIVAQNCFSRRPAQVEEAINTLLNAADPLVRDHPLYLSTLAAMVAMQQNGSTSDPSAIVTIQRQLALMNLIGHVFTRTRRREVNMGTVRKAVPLAIEFSEPEKSFYDTVTDYVIEVAEQQNNTAPQPWLLHMPQRRAASSIPAMVQHFRGIFGIGAVETTSPLEEETSEWDLPDDPDPPRALLTYEGSAAEKLRQIVSTWRSNYPDSKYVKLRTALRELRDEKPLKVLLFSFFKATLGYLIQRLNEDGYSCALMTGDMPIDERNDLMSRFRADASLEILLLSNVGSEGLDLQFCDTMFNYDLPWNPMELEQRIGRIDRIGQQSDTINIYNFWAKDTIEERVLKRLLERIGIFRTSVGEIDEIVGEQFQQIEREIFSHRLTREQQEERASAAELALARTSQLMQELEKESAQFLATEQFFQDEILRMKKLNGYVTPAQLRIFVEDFLSRECPRARLNYDDQLNMGTLVVDDTLANLIIRAPELAGRWAAGSRLPITFDGEAAYARTDLELVNVLHPLVRVVVQHYADDNRLIGRTHSMVLKTEEVEPGFWFFFLYEVTVHASMETSHLELVLVRDDLSDVRGGASTQQVLAEMLEQGSDSLEGNLEVPPDLVQKASDAAEDVIAGRKDDLVAEVQLRSDLFLRQQRASMEAYYLRKIRQDENLLQQDNMGRIGPAIRARLHKRKLAYAAKMAEIDEKSRAAIGEYSLWGCGILETATR